MTRPSQTIAGGSGQGDQPLLEPQLTPTGISSPGRRLGVHPRRAADHRTHIDSYDSK
jgi:hypothetical protein